MIMSRRYRNSLVKRVPELDIHPVMSCSQADGRGIHGPAVAKSILPVVELGGHREAGHGRALADHGIRTPWSCISVLQVCQASWSRMAGSHAASARLHGIIESTKRSLTVTGARWTARHHRADLAGSGVCAFAVYSFRPALMLASAVLALASTRMAAGVASAN